MRIGYEAKRIYHNSTGLGNYSRSLVESLSQYFPEDEYILYNPKPGKISFPNTANIQEHLPKGFVTQKLNSWWRRYGMAADARHDKIDLFHGLSGELPKKLNTLQIPSLVTIHDLIFERYPEWYKKVDRRIYRKKFKSAAQSADIVVSISEQTKRDLVEFYGIDENKIRVIKQGCNPLFDQEISPDERSSIRVKYNLPSEYFLYVGTIEERKNAHQIVKALALLPSHIQLVLVGRKTEYWNLVEKTMKELDVVHRVHHRNPETTEDLSAFYQNSLALVYPSIFEGFGIPIVEALYSKTPVITTGSGVFPEAGGPNSFYVNPESPEEIAIAMKTILNNPDLVAKMKSEGYTFAQQFNPEVVARQYHELYLQLMK